MSASEAAFLLSLAYERACHSAEYGPGVRRAFRNAHRAIADGDPKPAILLTYRYP